MTITTKMNITIATHPQEHLTNQEINMLNNKPFSFAGREFHMLTQRQSFYVMTALTIGISNVGESVRAFTSATTMSIISGSGPTGMKKTAHLIIHR